MVYTNHPEMEAMLGTTDDAFNGVGVRCVVHGAQSIRMLGEMPHTARYPLPLPVAKLNLHGILGKLGFKAGDSIGIPMDAQKSALASYWMLSRCDVLVVWLDSPDQDILAMLPLASMAGMPIVAVTNGYMFDPVVSSTMAAILRPHSQVIASTVGALVQVKDE